MNTFFTYFFLLFSLCSIQLTAQKSLKISSKTEIPKHPSVSKITSPSALTANMVCYGYQANGTYTLDLTLSLTNFDGEYADSLAITFPTGITPIGTPDLTFPTRDNGGVEENYAGIAGQTISWGANTNDFYGGIAGRNLNFRIVATTGSITGVQTATFHISGDGFYQWNPTADYDGTFQISPKLPVDLRVVEFFIPPYSCLNGTNDNIEIWLRNDGYNPTTGNVNLSYQVNTNAPVNESSSMSIAPNDTLKYQFTANANLSALGGYTITGAGSNVGDGNIINNQITDMTFSYPKHDLPYLTGFEPSPISDLQNWAFESLDSPNSWDTTSLNPYLGTTCMRLLENVPTTCDDWLFSSCLNLEVGKTYYVRYYTRLTSNYVGSLGVSLGTGQNALSMNQTLKPLTLLVADNTWTKDSISFTVASNDVYHLGFNAVNTTAEIIALRIDDISVRDVTDFSGIEHLLVDEVSIYPNPTTDILNIYSPNSILNIEIYNAIGQQVYIGKTAELGTNKLDISALAKGSYVTKFSNNRNIFYKHIIVN